MLLHRNTHKNQQCEEVTSKARSLRESYERQRPVLYHAVLSAYLEQEVVYEDDEDDEEEEMAAGFYGRSYFY